MGSHHYRHLVLMTAISFIAMYILMYAMVNSIGNVYNSLNEGYMAALMAAPMVVIEIAVMRSMYRDGRMNALYLAAAIIVGVGCWTAIRYQVAVTDRQFIRSMIPHHAGAILMCGEASIRDAELKGLCGEIISGQQREIDQMKTILRRLD